MRLSRKHTYYWDSCIFIAWLKDEPREPEVIAGIEEVVDAIHNNRANLMTSVITLGEVFEGKLKPEVAEKFKNIFKRRNVVQVNVDPKIADSARQIREYYNAKLIKIALPDSLHLATAILYEAREFHTFDGSGKRQRPGDILALNENVAGYPLAIRVPRKVQISLLSGIPPLDINR